MEKKSLADYRRERLQAFVDAKFGGAKAALGRALGFRDGAFVGQMLRGERPITEKTVDLVQALPGGKNWFSGDPLPDAEPTVTTAIAVESLAQSISALSATDRKRAASLLNDLGNDPEGPWSAWLIALLDTKAGEATLPKSSPFKIKHADLPTIPQQDNGTLGVNSKPKYKEMDTGWPVGKPKFAAFSAARLPEDEHVPLLPAKSKKRGNG